ncbi:decaprenylphosphoryl-beta-D-ribose oxidase, partial [Streptomyces sp. MBT97]|nr:decaprenylphosphoryl-beta-D-ribose oxidase [Streptomyces sp. MBT97]
MSAETTSETAPEITSVTGWGRTAPSAARLVRPRTYAEAVAAVRDCGPRGGIPRG